MEELTSSKWKRRGSSLVWHPALLGDLVPAIEAVPLRTLLGWMETGFPEDPPGSTPEGVAQTVLVGGLQTIVETMSQTATPDEVAAWLRTNILGVNRVWKTHWPSVGLVFIMDGPASLFEFNEGDEIVYFGRGRDRAKKVQLSVAIWNGAASGAGAYRIIAEKDGTREVGGYHVDWLS